MLISLNWVREHCSFETEEEPQKIGERFSLSTAEVESVQLRGAHLGQFVAARVEEVSPIAGDRKGNRVVRVSTGKGATTSVVCGAPNVRAGMIAPYAAPGTMVLGRKISRAKIRGVDSEGMLLAEDELEISDSHAGLLELASQIAPGTRLDEIFPHLADVILEVDNKSITHRPDLWGHYGIAREFSTIYGEPVRPYPVDESLAAAGGDAEVTVRIDGGEASRRCLRYCGLRIDGVRVAPSPDWLRHRLYAVGSRPINNIVDVTNYILFDLGQPLHAFDREKLRRQQVLVRMPAPGESLRLLDGREVRLHAEDLLIADGEGGVALAGVMGGEDSEISGDTVSIFLESANFDSTSVRRTSLRHGRTESSARFEKALDPQQARLGILRAAAMILELCPGARVVGPLQDVGFTPPEPIVIDVEPEFIPNRLGSDISTGATRDILTRLGFRVDDGGRGWSVTVPSWRATRDIELREDLVEEVGRIHGYGAIEPFAPAWPVSAPAVNEKRRLERRIKRYLTLYCELTEVFTYSMVGESHCRFFGLDPDAHLRLRNPMSEDMDRMRREVVPIHLEKARENQRFLDTFGFFELGRVYLKEPERLRQPELPTENTRIAGVVVHGEKDSDHFYELRESMLSLFEHLEIDSPAIEPIEATRSWVHPTVGARLLLGEAPAGCFYRIHPDAVRRLELRGDVYAFDLDFDALSAAAHREIQYRALPQFPAVSFDVDVVAGERIPVRSIMEVIRTAAGSLLESVEVFDIYRGEAVGSGKKSVTLRCIFRAADHTLSPGEVDHLQDGAVAALEAAGYPLRA